MTAGWTLALIVALAGLSPGCDNTHRRVTVVKMALFLEPDNLADDPQCRALWGSLAEAGMEMDDLGPDWNDIVLDSAYFLIERGCVKRLVPGVGTR